MQHIPVCKRGIHRKVKHINKKYSGTGSYAEDTYTDEIPSQTMSLILTHFYFKSKFKNQSINFPFFLIFKHTYRQEFYTSVQS